ncbi:peroxiredoxin [Altericroceibacterium endophyticum]|uniref:thioredoxin-dependent peroxiredoxin n=1 Tax=Altericroceibacterium endophyticum TaxID=1808508 RepID=A0A6I4T5U7_9SPHN|nr:peroxiredoxin [Altericroceibacterium endophyticum]MXO65799.1 redoxin domain-containing protein [Altericroceibacterium endophyticum]
MSKRPEQGDMVPDVVMQTPDGGEIRPSDFRGRKLVLFFYPRDNTPGCTTENKDFSALLPEFEQADTALLGISKDSPKKHQNFIAKQDLKAPLASDPAENGLADALGIWVEKMMYGKTHMGLERSTYLIDAEGRIVRIWRKVKVKDHAQEVLEAAKRFDA